ncbi:MAG: MotA/TolQ/ExbB proton channel family protein [Planctomycetes bacterium]|nr:MotA/TolQ/ExbB proton channel family protein [Planctomycetota bacterium]
MLQFFRCGGPVMYPLLLCSFVSLTVIIERIIFWIREAKNRDRKLLDSILGEAEQGNLAKAREMGKDSKDAFIQVVHYGLGHRAASRVNALEMAASDAIERMRRGLPILDTIITMAPLLGILGTVMGIIESFDLLGQSGIEDPKAVTGGIAQALITTAAGLTVALLTLVPYNYLITKVERAVRDMEKYITSIEIFCQKGEIENSK